MERIPVYFVRLLGRSPYIIVNMVIYLGLLVLSIDTTVYLISIPDVLKFISPFNSIFNIFIIYTIVFLICTIYYSFYVYIRFIKYPLIIFLRVVFVIILVTAAVLVLKQFDGCEVGYSLSEPIEYTYFFLVLLLRVSMMMGVLLFLSLVRERSYGHVINTHFKLACSEIKHLEKSHNSEMSTYKDLHTVHSASAEYARGIREIKNLLLRGIEPDWVFDSKTELSLKELLDWLTFSMQYYLFYGGPEQMEAVKNHLKCMIKNFDGEYRINADLFTHGILRMYNEIDTYFKENNIYIARSTKFTDRIRSHSPQVLLAIVLLVISIITKYIIIK